MPRLQVLIISVLFLVLGSEKSFSQSQIKNAQLANCSSYTVTGKLSDNLNKEPELSTFSEEGVPVVIILKTAGLKSFELMKLRGKTIQAAVNITAVLSARRFRGETSVFKLAPPIGLAPGAGNPKARFLSKTACLH